MTEADYAPEVSVQVFKRIGKVTRASLLAGYPVISSSGHWFETNRDETQAIAKECNANFIGIWLEAPRDILTQRISKRLSERERGTELSVEKGHASDACLAVLDKYEKLIEPPTSSAWHHIDASVEAELVLGSVQSLIVN